MTKTQRGKNWTQAWKERRALLLDRAGPVEGELAAADIAGKATKPNRDDSRHEPRAKKAAARKAPAKKASR